MDVTRERIRRILELREILLSFQTGFNLVNAAIVYAIPESISGLEPSSVIIEPRYLLEVLLPINFHLGGDATGVGCHQLGLPGTDLHRGCTFGGVYIPCSYSHAEWSYRRRFRSLLLCPLSVERYYFPLFVDLSPCRRLWRLCRDAQLILPVLLPLLLSHRCHQQKRRLVIVLPPMPTVPS